MPPLTSHLKSPRVSYAWRLYAMEFAAFSARRQQIACGKVVILQDYCRVKAFVNCSRRKALGRLRCRTDNRRFLRMSFPGEVHDVEVC